ncbi:MAG: peptidoglycan-binding protein [Desulfarculaceae bacterium]|nr:peptidoglycan-binding protein [Desulfarculaceae bacterium]MCF8072798.1 peptidoglycan-binding protein [Desulfarculaceae bacterium]MCF8100966.1 peptidoglycan-binding protein [Desulfarculaceae bacterium]MCF8118530.1 peptidoglycan-binding protein [Desulfarculaceae bacterium]
MGARAETVKITGLVIPVEWDQQGKVKAVAIAAFDESTYRVASGGRSEELLGRLKREVTVWGRVECLAEGTTILIERFEMSKSSKGKITGLALATVVSMALCAAPMALAADQPAAADKPAMAKPMKAKPMKAVKVNPKVRVLQDTLNKNGAKLKVDGIWGKKTKMALKQFQEAKGLKVTGKVDKATKAALGLK